MSGTLSALADNLFEIRQAYYDAIGAKIVQVRGKPAAMERIAELQRVVGHELPASYVEFLTLNDGWSHWAGDIHMLSIDQILSGEVHDWIRQWKRQAAQEGDDLVVDGFIIACQLHSGSGLILDPNEENSRGEWTIVNWDNGLVSRYNSMHEMMAADIDEWEALFAEARTQGSS